MNTLTQTPSQISEADYLARYAQESDTRYEYINGEIWAMAGASRNHTTLSQATPMPRCTPSSKTIPAKRLSAIGACKPSIIITTPMLL